MNYIWGRLSDIIARFTENSIINGCDEKIMHAKFNNGKNPKIALFYYQNRTQALVANEYVSYDELPLDTRFLCGGGQRDLRLKLNHTKNVVLQSFSLMNNEIFQLLDN